MESGTYSNQVNKGEGRLAAFLGARDHFQAEGSSCFCIFEGMGFGERLV
jgi:hypothetical protein